MNWTLIETKWTEMARRVRPDWAVTKCQRGGSTPQDTIPADNTAARVDLQGTKAADEAHLVE
ncbi:hypothetical protein [Albirhodobacter sp. R86504]|uniref:hypothetical protein n=1 Tax=Albirhodobacter sp. R86504 TaxID=3093848 RepID=UPI00366D62BD